jgi:hypothetical protein
VSLAATWAAHCPALLTFGGDIAVELLSSAVVLRRFYRLLCWVLPSCDLGSAMGRPGRGLAFAATNSAREMGSDEGQAVLQCRIATNGFLGLIYGLVAIPGFEPGFPP